MDPGFAQDNPWIARIHASRTTYILFFCLSWKNFIKYHKGYFAGHALFHIMFSSITKAVWSISHCVNSTTGVPQAQREFTKHYEVLLYSWYVWRALKCAILIQQLHTHKHMVHTTHTCMYKCSGPKHA